MSGNAWVTLVTNDSYALGALVLAHSLIRANTIHNLVVLVTPGVTSSMRDQLRTIFNEVKEVNVLDSKDETNLALLSRPELGITFTKLHCWQLTQYSKCVFLDADTLVLQNCDELFDREELSAAPDAGWPDCFNSGVFVYTPSLDTFNALVQFAVSQGSFDGGDQGLLNQFFSDWASQDIGRHLPFIYNMCSSATYSYLPAYKQFGELVKIVHFIGPNKPWLLHFDTETRQVRPPPGVEHLHTLLQIWWDFFCDNVHPTLSPTMIHRDVTPVSHFVADLILRLELPPPILDSDPDYGFLDPWESYQLPPISQPESHFDPSYFSPHHPHDDSPFIYHPNHSQLSHREDIHHDFSQQFNAISNSSKHTNDDNLNLSTSNQTQLLDKQSKSVVLFEEPIQTVENVHDEGSSQNQYSETRWHFNTQDDQFKSPHFHKTLHYESSDPIVQINTTDQYLINHKKHPPIHDECDITSENAHFVDEKDYKNESSLSYDQNAGLAGAFAQMTLGVSRSSEQTALEEHMRKHAWEHGNADYMGVDSFDNIWKKICETLSTKDGEEESSALKNVSDSEPSSFSIENASMVVKTNLEELTPASPLQVSSSSKQTTITTPIEALVKPQKPESIKVVLPIHPEMESTDKLQSRKTDEQQEQKKESVLVSSPLPLVSHSSKDILSPSTPLVTEATPPTSPPIASKIDSQALVVETPPIETPPVSTDIPKFTAAKSTPESSSVESVKPSLAEQTPVPPKRRGAKGDSGKATVSQPSKGSKTGQKGKK